MDDDDALGCLLDAAPDTLVTVSRNRTGLDVSIQDAAGFETHFHWDWPLGAIDMDALEDAALRSAASHLLYSQV